jgi:hypothetical protein
MENKVMDKNILIKALIALAALSTSANADDAASWKLWPTLGKTAGADVKWEAGDNWTHALGNPRADRGATWRVAVQAHKDPWIGDPYVDMTSGVVNGNASWIHPETELAYRGSALIAKSADKTAHRGPASAILFTPPTSGWFRVVAQGTLKVQIPSAGRADAGFYTLTPRGAVHRIAEFSAGMTQGQQVDVAVDRVVRLEPGDTLVARVQTVNPGPASADRSWLTLSRLDVSSAVEPATPDPLEPVVKESPKPKAPAASRKPAVVLPLEAMPTESSVALRLRDGPATAEQEADVLLDSFEEVVPRWKFNKMRGKPNVSVEVRDGIAAHGGRSLHVNMEPPTEEGYHEAGLVWTFDPPIDLSEFEGMTANIRAHFDYATRFFVILAEPEGVLWRGTFSLESGRAGEWQSLTIPNVYGWYQEGRQPNPPRKRIDRSDPALKKIASIRFRLYAGIKEPCVFDLDGLGFVRRRNVYEGPTVSLQGAPVRRDGEPFAMTAHCSGNALPEPVEVLLATVDFAGRTNWLGRAVVPPGVAEADIPVAIPNPGAGFWSLKALVRSRGEDLVQVSRGLAAIVPMAPEDAGPNPDSIFGVWVGGNPKEIGAKWTRQYVWGNQLGDDPSILEREPTGPAHRRMPEGISSLIHFTYTPKWMSSRPGATDYGKYPPTDWDAYGRYIEWVTQGTKAGGYKLYEIWNEPNPHAYWMGSVDELVKLAETTFKAVKKVDPEARVLGPCPYGFTLDFIEDFFAKGGTNWIDDVVLHTYSPVPPDDHFLPGLQQLRKLMEKYGLGDRDVYITEMGYGTPSVSERDTATHLVRAYVYAWSENVKVMIWHMLQALSADGDPEYALKYKNGTPRPAYVAYAVMTRMLEGATLRGPAPGLTGGQRGFDFERRGALIRVVWDKAAARGATSAYHTALPAGRVTATDLVGAAAEVPRQADGAVAVDLGMDPLYIVVEPSEAE